MSNKPRRIVQCTRCRYSWPPVAERPASCPKCKCKEWDREPPIAPDNPPKPPPPPCEHALTCRSEYAAFLERRAETDAESIADYRERRKERRYLPGEVDVRPPMMQDGVPLVLGRLTLTRRKKRTKGTQ